MLQQEVDRLIDFVINNNIKTKTIKNLGKARFKKTTLPEVPSTMEWLAENEKKQKEAAAAVKKTTDQENRLKKLKEMSAKDAASKAADNADEFYDPQEMIDPALLDEISRATENYDPEDVFYDPDELPEEVVEEPVDVVPKKPKSKKQPPLPKKQQTTFKSIRGFINNEKNEDRKAILSDFIDLLSEWTINPGVSEKMVKSIVDYYSDDRSLLADTAVNRENACGVLAYLFHCVDPQDVSAEVPTRTASFLTKQQDARYNDKVLNRYTFQIAGKDNSDILFLARSETYNWSGDYFVPESLNEDATLLLSKLRVPVDFMSRRKKVPFIITRAHAEEVTDEEPEIESVDDDQKGGWIWLLA